MMSEEKRKVDSNFKKGEGTDYIKLGECAEGFGITAANFPCMPQCHESLLIPLRTSEVFFL